MFKLPWELERPPVPPANPPTPKTTGQADQPDQPKKKRKPRKKAMSFLSEEEIERLFGVIASIRDRAIFRLAYHAGLRASEIGMLQLRDYDPKTAKIFVHRLKGSNSGEHLHPGSRDRWSSGGAAEDLGTSVNFGEQGARELE